MFAVWLMLVAPVGVTYPAVWTVTVGEPTGTSRHSTQPFVPVFALRVGLVLTETPAPLSGCEAPFWSCTSRLPTPPAAACGTFAIPSTVIRSVCARLERRGQLTVEM